MSPGCRVSHISLAHFLVVIRFVVFCQSFIIDCEDCLICPPGSSAV